MIISIDGPAGSGKSTIAKILSEKLGFIHFNSGSLYRGVAVYLKKTNFNFKTLNDNIKMPKFNFKVGFENGTMLVWVNNLDCSKYLRDNEISVLSPRVSTNKFVRAQIDEFQREFAKMHNVVIDGRDIGSHVFPNAEFKFYLDCSLDERAKRRLKEEKAKGNNITLKEIKAQIAARDEIDKHKKYAPLVVPDDAIIIDSTSLDINQVVNTMLGYIK